VKLKLFFCVFGCVFWIAVAILGRIDGRVCRPILRNDPKRTNIIFWRHVERLRAQEHICTENIQNDLTKVRDEGDPFCFCEAFRIGLETRFITRDIYKSNFTPNIQVTSDVFGG